jgi:glycosyltransferase involved in cell wall biosynthesis
VVVVDNDQTCSAKSAVLSFKDESRLPVEYYVEPEQNIALARNKALENVEGAFIAFIDDDEFPNADWLLNLYKAAIRYNSDGVLGPVVPHFEADPPRWVLKGHFFDRPTHPTGYVLGWRNTRTGNTLLRRLLFNDDGKQFNPRFGSGGEDRDFFRRKIEKGYVFVWCNEAPVFEIVPPERWKKSVIIKRALLRGKVAYVNATSKPWTLLRSALAVVVYTLCMPVFLLLGYDVFMRFLIKDCDHIGKILAFLGVDLVKEKYVTG